MQHASIGTMQHAMNTNPFYASMSDDQKQRLSTASRIRRRSKWRSASAVFL